MLVSAASRFWTHPSLPRLFPLFLSELYTLVRCSVPLMRSALRRAGELAPGDPLSAHTAEYLVRHIDEETHHDEWLLEDMVACGFDRATVLSLTPSPNVAALIGAQYCWIFHAHPVALFGYLAAVEGNPPLSRHLIQIEKDTGFPAQAFRCLHEHAEQDADHQEELKSVMHSLPLDAGTSSLITMSGFSTIHGLSRIFRDLSRRDNETPNLTGARL